MKDKIIAKIKLKMPLTAHEYAYFMLYMRGKI